MQCNGNGDESQGKSDEGEGLWCGLHERKLVIGQSRNLRKLGAGILTRSQSECLLMATRTVEEARGTIAVQCRLLPWGIILAEARSHLNRTAAEQA